MKTIFVHIQRRGQAVLFGHMSVESAKSRSDRRSLKNASTPSSKLLICNCNAPDIRSSYGLLHRTIDTRYRYCCFRFEAISAEVSRFLTTETSFLVLLILASTILGPLEWHISLVKVIYFNWRNASDIDIVLAKLFQTPWSDDNSSMLWSWLSGSRASPSSTTLATTGWLKITLMSARTNNASTHFVSAMLNCRYTWRNLKRPCSRRRYNHVVSHVCKLSEPNTQRDDARSFFILKAVGGHQLYLLYVSTCPKRGSWCLGHGGSITPILFSVWQSDCCLREIKIVFFHEKPQWDPLSLQYYLN